MAHSSDKMNIKPFLKWAGGKRQLLASLEDFLPNQYGKYIEPFLGGGALFFYLQPHQGVIGDSNAELMNTYRVVRDQVDILIQTLSDYPHDKDFYYKLRAKQPADLSDIARAARFVYLNRTCFNGLYRVNKKGEFNVPFGSYKNPRICDGPTLRLASKALQSVEIITDDYLHTLKKYTKKGDLVFLDPPYYPISEYSDFKRYTKDFFYAEDHERLANVFKELSDAGVYVILTNSNAPFVRELYKDFFNHLVSSNRNINSIGSRRTNGEDLVVLSEPLVQAMGIF